MTVDQFCAHGMVAGSPSPQPLSRRERGWGEGLRYGITAVIIHDVKNEPTFLRHIFEAVRGEIIEP